MGKSLAAASAAARAVFAEAEEALGYSVSKLCWEGSEDQLRLTEYTQPALLTVSVAAMASLREGGIPEPHYVAGHSLGEYSALVAAGALRFADAARVVRNRGRYMQEAVPAGEGAMAALLRLPEGRLEAVLAEAGQGQVVSAANLNSPDQVVIAGHAAAVARAIELAKAAGAKRAVLLPVSAPFHCTLMEPARRRLAADLAELPFADPKVTVVNNFAAMEVRTAEEARQGLIDQVPNPVRWTDSIRKLTSLGVTRFVEVGPGAVLSGLLRGLAPEAESYKFGDWADWGKLARLRNQA